MKKIQSHLKLLDFKKKNKKEFGDECECNSENKRYEKKNWL